MPCGYKNHIFVQGSDSKRGVRAVSFPLFTIVTIQAGPSSAAQRLEGLTISNVSVSRSAYFVEVGAVFELIFLIIIIIIFFGEINN